MKQDPPAVDYQDVQVARALGYRVEIRACRFMDDSGKWEECTKHFRGGRAVIVTDGGEVGLWCYALPGDEWWRPVPAYGSDDGLMAVALEQYANAHSLDASWRRIHARGVGDIRVHDTMHYVSIGGEFPQDLGVVEICKPTFAQAARATLLQWAAMEDM